MGGGVGGGEGGGGRNKAVIGATVLVGRWPVPPLSTHNGRVQTGQGKHPEIVIFMMKSKSSKHPKGHLGPLLTLGCKTT